MGAWLTDWKEEAHFEKRMAELDTLLHKKIRPTEEEGRLDVFLSHDFGAPADGQKPSNQERATKIKQWLEARGKWKADSSVEPLMQERRLAASNGASTSADGAPPSNASAPTGPCNGPGFWDFMVSCKPAYGLNNHIWGALNCHSRRLLALYRHRLAAQPKRGADGVTAV